MSSTPTYTYHPRYPSLLIREEWLADDIDDDGDDTQTLHRTNDPAFREWQVIKGKRYLTKEVWWLEGEMHCETGPAYRTWTVVKGHRYLTEKGWYLKGELHREDGAAWKGWECYDGDDEEEITRVLTEADWWLEGQRHRVGDPAVQRWSYQPRTQTTFLASEDYYRRGRRHRVGGPAMSEWREDGRIWGEEWYVNGEKRVGEKRKRGDREYLQWEYDEEL